MPETRARLLHSRRTIVPDRVTWADAGVLDHYILRQHFRRTPWVGPPSEIGPYGRVESPRSSHSVVPFAGELPPAFASGFRARSSMQPPVPSNTLTTSSGSPAAFA